MFLFGASLTTGVAMARLVQFFAIHKRECRGKRRLCYFQSTNPFHPHRVPRDERNCQENSSPEPLAIINCTLVLNI